MGKTMNKKAQDKYKQKQKNQHKMSVNPKENKVFSKRFSLLYVS